MRIWTIVFAATLLSGQSFDIASVKRLPQPADGTSSGGGPGTQDPGRWWRYNVTLGSLLVQAFPIQGHAIVGPDWLTSTRYDIVATVPAGAQREDIPLMIQRLLAERFALQFHREKKEMPGYALVTSRDGPKLKPAGANPAAIPGRNGFSDIPEGIAAGVIKVDSVGTVRRISAGAMSLPQFADYLAGQNDFLIMDLTELPGTYDIVFYYARPRPLFAETPPDNTFDLRTALRDQLGLELQTRKIPVDLLVIDHIEQTPTAN